MSVSNDDDGGPPGCGPGCSCAGNEFGEREVRRELAAYRRKGPPETTRWLVEGLRAGGIEGMTVLDIGAGVGAVHHELLGSGASTALDVDGSPAYVDAAREEASRRGLADRVSFRAGDFVTLAPEIEPADLVALDRVVCCYPDVQALVRLSATHARRRLGLVYPRDTWWIRAGASALNVLARLFRRRVTAWVHPTSAVEAIVFEAGLDARYRRSNLFWQVVVFERPVGA